MSDIRITSTGDIFYKIDSQIANMLMAALPTVFERVPERHPHQIAAEKAAAIAADPSAVTFSVRKNHYNDRYQVDMIQGNYVEAFQGTPDALIDYPFGGKANRRCPKEIVEQYRMKWDAMVREDQARYAAQFNR